MTKTKFHSIIKSHVEKWENAYGNGSSSIQIDFIKRYVAYRSLSGESQDTLDRIEKFLSYQTKDERTEIELVFQGGHSGIPLCVYVNSLQEFDFADSWEEERYEIISISNNKWKTWTQKRIDKIIEDIRDDFEYDDYEVEIELESGEVGQPASEPISLYLDIEE